MDRKEFQHRRADKVPLDQSKKQLWSYIQKKTEKKPSWYEGFLNFFRGHKISFISTMAVILILVVATYNFNFSLVTPTPVHASFEMIANEEDSTGIEADGSFTLKASEDVSEKTIETHLKVTPEIKVKVNKTAEGQYKIIPEENLEPGQVYQFSILSEIEGKAQEFSWAYQVKDTFKVMGTLPADQSNNIPIESAIELNFTHENYDFDHIQDYFEIMPKTEGSFEKHLRTIVFVPNHNLKVQTLYTVRLKEGFKLNDADQKIKEAYQFQFVTDGDQMKKSGVEFKNPYYEVAENKTMGLPIMGTGFNSPPPASPLEVSIYQFPNAEAYLEALKKRAQIPPWARNFEFPLLATEKLKSMGNFEAIYDEVEYNEFIYLPTANLKKGFYLFQLQNPDFKSQALVQVTNLSAYLNVTQTDTLLWVNDVKTALPVSDAKIETLDREALGTSNEKGIAVFKTPDYLENPQVSEILKITAKDQVLFHFMQSDSNDYRHDNNPNYWYQFATDRPTYKPTDQIKFWGFIEPKEKDFKIDNLHLKLMKNFDGGVIVEKDLELSPRGTFKGEINVQNLTQAFYFLALYQDDTLILRNELYVQNYNKPAYQIKVEPEKKAIFAGEDMNFKIESSFFEGTPLPQLDLAYEDNWSKKGVIKTNLEGEANLKIESPNSGQECFTRDCSTINPYALSVAPIQAEETDIQGEAVVTVFNSKIALEVKGEAQANQAKIEVSSHLVDLAQFEATGDYLGNFISAQKIDGEVTEVSWENEETGQYYDYIDKKTKKTYRYNQVEKPLKNFVVTTNENGKAQYEFEIKPDKYYKVLLKTLDQEGRVALQMVYIYGEMGARPDASNSYYLQLLNGVSYDGPYDVGEEVKTFFNGPLIPNPGTKGQFLFQQSSNGLKDYIVKDSPSYDFKFETQDVPNVYVSGVWFTGDQYIAPYVPLNVNYKKELKRLTIEINPDKKTYKPGDEVNLKIKVTDKDKKPVKAEVNLNLVDEAYYKLFYEALMDPLLQLYLFNEEGKIYTYDTHKTPLLTNLAFEGGGGCFVAGTKIWMADGTYKNIEDIHAGDLILTKKTPLSPEMISAKVLSTVVHQVGNYLVFNENLKVTQEHILFVNGQFNIAGEVKIGDKLLDKDNQYVEVHSIREVKEPVKVYNFQVENQHTYFANDFYVHNDKGSINLRTDFQDNAVFQTIQTDSEGFGEITFKLPDNITSWRATARAIDSQDLQAGVGVISVPVSLPLFTDLIINQEYSLKDEPLVKFRAYGDRLKKEDSIDFKISSKTLPISEKHIPGVAYVGAYLNLPPLSAGKHEIILQVTAGKLKDALLKEFEVVNSRLRKNHLEFFPKITADTALKLAKDGLSELSFVDGGRGHYYYDLMNIYYSQGGRLDQKISQLGAQELFQTYFQENNLPKAAFQISTYQSANSGGLRLIPYADTDLELTVLTLLMDPHPQRFSQEDLKEYFYNIYQDKEANIQEIVLALVGLATLDEPVLTSLKLIQNEPKLNFKEKLYIGLAFEALGDKQEAQKIFQTWYIEAGKSPESTQTTALGAVLASALNDQNAEDIWNSTLNLQKSDEFLGLYQLGYLKNRLKFAQSEPVQFNLIKNGEKETIKLEKGVSYSAFFSPEDEVKIQILQGQLAGAVHYQQEATIDSFKNQEGLTIERTYSVKGKDTTEFKEGDIVKVSLKVFAEKTINKTSFWITDILPSGLTPLTSAPQYIPYGFQEDTMPYEIDGQQIHFIWYPLIGKGKDGYEIPQGNATFNGGRVITYLARVVNPGKFYADPAKIESFKDPEVVSISKENWVEIGKLE